MTAIHLLADGQPGQDTRSVDTSVPSAVASSAGGQLDVRVLHTAEDRQQIAHLRQYADFRSEYDVDPGMAALDPVKDALGLVMGFFLDGVPIATMRFIPSGHGVTLTERWWGGFVEDRALLRAGSWKWAAS